jgi:hypothetical protein
MVTIKYKGAVYTEAAIPMGVPRRRVAPSSSGKAGLCPPGTHWNSYYGKCLRDVRQAPPSKKKKVAPSTVRPVKKEKISPDSPHRPRVHGRCPNGKEWDAATGMCWPKE